MGEMEVSECVREREGGNFGGGIEIWGKFLKN